MCYRHVCRLSTLREFLGCITWPYFVLKTNKQLSFSTSLVAWWSELLTTNHEDPGSIPGSTMCVFP